MAEQLQQLFQAARVWAAGAASDGWLPVELARQIEAVEAASPADLFDDNAARPLVVALFGGTGVGKSSLLNRLAGAEIARVGVRRPTSHEVTLYHHADRVPDRLPAEFPLDRVRTAVHHDDARRNVLWIDMPDIDSTDAGNRDLVLQWLPHVDVAVYVVSPERYRDDQGWRLFRQRSEQSAWLFVMNHWDRGRDEQVDDLRQLLRGAGFAEPLIFRTDCSNAVVYDDFADLQRTIGELAADQRRASLAQLGAGARVRALRQALVAARGALGDPVRSEQLREHWRTLWRDTASTIRDGLSWAVQHQATQLVDGKGNPARMSADDPSLLLFSAPQLWDDWAQTRLQDSGLQLTLAAEEIGLAKPPLQAHLAEGEGDAAQLVRAGVDSALRRALAKPGGALRRGLWQFAGGLIYLLPLAALAWVAWVVVSRFVLGSSGQGDFLQTNFAVHALLLVATAWGLPWLAHRALEPSPKQAAIRGLELGLEQGMAAVDDRIERELEDFEQQRAAFAAEAEALIERCRPFEALKAEPDEFLTRSISQPRKDH